MDDQLDQAALDYHRFPAPGKIAVLPTKAMMNQRDLSLAYSPGVAVPCLEIQKDPLAAYDYTSKGNLVAVVSNGTAVLGLGNIGALAGKVRLLTLSDDKGRKVLVPADRIAYVEIGEPATRQELSWLGTSRG